MKRFLGLVVIALLMVTSRPVQAQNGYAATELNQIQSVGNANIYSTDRIRNSVYNAALPNLGAGAGIGGNLFKNVLNRPNKPFASVSKGPSVTPYLALDQPFTNTATQYYTQVRPQLEQQRLNQQMQHQSQMMQRQLSEVTARPPYDPRGSEYLAPTGHAAGFMSLGNYMNYGGYYQQPRPARR
jgi:hypothetical protein